MKKISIIILLLIVINFIAARDIYSPLDINAQTLAGKWHTVGVESYINIYQTDLGGTILQFEFPYGCVRNRYSFSVIHHNPNDIQLRLYPLPGYPSKSSLHIYNFNCNNGGDLYQIYWVDGISNCWMEKIIDY